MDAENSTVNSTAQAAQGQDGGEETTVESMTNGDFAMVEVPEATETGERAPEIGAGADADVEAGEQDAPVPQEDGTTAAKAKKQPQTPEENHAFAAMRRKAHREAMQAAEEAMSSRVDEVIAGSGVINPYTKQPFHSLKEFSEYGETCRKAKLAKQARETGRSVEDLEEEAANRAFLSKLRRSTEQQDTARQAQTEEQAQWAFIQQDALDFAAKHPEFGMDEIGALERNPAFRRFCGSRFGREPLAELYDDYRSVVGDAGASAVARASSRSARSTASGTGGSAVLTPEQKKALDKWNRDNPEMKMTAKEFLSR